MFSDVIKESVILNKFSAYTVRNNYLEYIVTNYLTINKYKIHNILK